MNIHYWWDRHTRSWVIQLKDISGNQIGEADYCGNKQDRDYVIKSLKENNEIEKVIKE